jgi:cytochrome P450
MRRSTLVTYDVGKCPALSGTENFDPFDPRYLRDPYPVARSLANQTPALRMPGTNTWVITRAADIERIFLNPATFSAVNAQAPTFPLSADAVAVLRAGKFNVLPTMSNVDPPEHSRIRKVNLRALSPNRIAQLEPAVTAAGRRLVTSMLEKPTFDIVAELSFPLPAFMIFRLIGFPPEDTEMLKSWSANRVAFSWGRQSPQEQARIAGQMVKYWHYCQNFVQERAADLRDDLTSDHIRLHLEDPSRISLEEIASIVYGLSFAGHETTTNLTTNLVRLLLENRTRWEALREDPSRIPGAVEEALRYDSSLITWRRRTRCDVNVGGVDIPAGADLLLLIGGANRDPERFADPERYDMTRADSTRHFSFGKGVHHCLGAPLARMEVKIAIELLLELGPDLELIPNQELRFPANVSFRGPEQLWLRRSPRQNEVLSYKDRSVK